MLFLENGLIKFETGRTAQLPAGDEASSLRCDLQTVFPRVFLVPHSSVSANCTALVVLELRFEAQMETEIQDYQSRRFRVIFYIANETVGIDEVSGNNSGFYNGKFCARARAKNRATGKWFRSVDFFPGATVEINSVHFKLIRADQRTLNYMEQHTETFPYANAKAVASKVWPLAERLHGSHPVIPAKELQAMAKKEIGQELLDHELITLARKCGAPEAEGLGDDTTIDLTQVLGMAR